MSTGPREAVRMMSDRLSTPIGNFVHAVEVPAGAGLLFLSGMTSRAEDGSVMYVGDAGAQTRRILENIQTLLGERGLGIGNVVKVVVYVSDMSDLEAVHAARREVFVETMPASTLVEVSAFVHPDMLVEIDSVAYIPPAA